MADFLRGMEIASRRRVRRAASIRSEAQMRAVAADAPESPPLVPAPEGFDIIAEVKRHAPSSGGGGGRRLERDFSPRLTAEYAAAGAVAVSVLTEPLAFAGSLADLAAAGAVARRAERPVPTLRKDFIVDPYQMFEARAADAGGVLLIADMMPANGRVEADALLEAAAEAGLWLLVEAFADDRLIHAAAIARRAADLGVHALLGVNARDLRSLATDTDRHRRLAGRLQDDVSAVAESGLRGPEDAARVARLGYGYALVGSALATATDPGRRLAAMLRAGRAARREAA